MKIKIDLVKKREKIKIKNIKKHTKLIHKDIKFKYLRGDDYYLVCCDSTSVIQLKDIKLVSDIVENYLKTHNIEYKKIITKYDPSFIGKICYRFDKKGNKK